MQMNYLIMQKSEGGTLTEEGPLSLSSTPPRMALMIGYYLFLNIGTSKKIILVNFF